MLPPSPLTDPDVQISRFRFLTGELRSQRCSNDTVRDSLVKKRSCQFSYPLPFREQVCETQSSLPCCPSAVLSSRRPPFLDRIPARPVLRRHQYYEGATTSHSRIPGHLFVSLPGPTRFLLGSCSPLPALPGGWRSRYGPGSLFSRRSRLPARSHVDVSGISQVSRRPILCLCPGPRPRPDRRTLAITGSSMLPLLTGQQRLQRNVYIEATAGLKHLLSTLQERCCHRHMQDSLPAGWLAFTGRELNPLDRNERFPSCYISFPFPGLILTLPLVDPDPTSPGKRCLHCALSHSALNVCGFRDRPPLDDLCLLQLTERVRPVLVIVGTRRTPATTPNSARDRAGTWPFLFPSV